VSVRESEPFDWNAGLIFKLPYSRSAPSQLIRATSLFYSYPPRGIIMPLMSRPVVQASNDLR